MAIAGLVNQTHNITDIPRFPPGATEPPAPWEWRGSGGRGGGVEVERWRWRWGGAGAVEGW